MLLGGVADLGVDHPVGGEVLDALPGDPGECVGRLHHRDGVVEGLEVALQRARVGRLREPPPERLGVAGRQVVADLAGELDDRLRAQPTVEVVVEEHLGRPVYLVTGGSSHPPILPPMRVFTSLDEVAAARARSSAPPTGSPSTRTGSTSSPTRPATTSGSTSTSSGPPAGPFGGTIAHGYLTLSLVPWLGSQVFSLETPGAKLNYGVNKVRFPNPVRVGSRVRNTVSVGDVTDLPSGKQLTLKHVVEIEGEDKPACVAETVVSSSPDPLRRGFPCCEWGIRVPQVSRDAAHSTGGNPPLNGRESPTQREMRSRTRGEGWYDDPSGSTS